MQHLVRNAPDVVAERAQGILDQGPAIKGSYALWWTAFNELSTDRPASMGGLCSIPRTAIRNYALELGLTRSEYHELRTIVRIVDAHVISVAADKARKAASK